MSQPTLAAQVRHQITGGPTYLYERLNELLAVPKLQRVRIAAAYARWDGIGLIANRLEAFLKAGGDFQCIYGVNNGVTTPDSFLYSLYLKELYQGRHSYAGWVEDAYANAIFHPKFFEFKFPDKVIALVGSANFTGGGLVRNGELCIELKASADHAIAAELEVTWTNLKGASKAVTIEEVRKLRTQAKLSSEGEDETKRSSNEAKPTLNVSAQLAPKPLFRTILKVSAPTKKDKLLKKLDPLSQKPKRLYLQILAKETGGQNGTEGYQVQIPSATLPAYFGVSPTKGKDAIFRFATEDIKTSFTHFRNNTHRVRLRPILDVPRPAILEFERIGVDEYRCRMMPKAQYASLLKNKATQQTRAGSRRWGME